MGGSVSCVRRVPLAAVEKCNPATSNTDMVASTWWFNSLKLPSRANRTIVSMLNLRELRQLMFTNIAWANQVGKYIDYYDTSLISSSELKWIQKQVNKSIEYFQQTLLLELAGYFVTARVHRFQSGYEAQVAGTQDKLVRFYGHYSPHPDLAMALLTSFGASVDDTIGQEHSLYFCLSYRTHQKRMSQYSFIDHCFRILTESMKTCLPVFEMAEQNIKCFSDAEINKFVTEFLSDEEAVDGRTMTTKGIFQEDILYHNAESLQAIAKENETLEIETRERLIKIISDALLNYERTSRSVVEACDFALENIDMLCKNICKNHFGRLFKSVASPDRFCRTARDMIAVKLKESPRYFNESYEDIVAVVQEHNGLPEKEAIACSVPYKFQDLYPDLDFSVERFPLIESEVICYLDIFIDIQKPRDIPREFPSRPENFTEEHSNGWFLKYLFKLFNDSGTMETMIRDYAIRCYCNHSLMKLNVLFYYR